MGLDNFNTALRVKPDEKANGGYSASHPQDGFFMLRFPFRVIAIEMIGWPVI